MEEYRDRQMDKNLRIFREESPGRSFEETARGIYKKWKISEVVSTSTSDGVPGKFCK